MNTKEIKLFMLDSLGDLMGLKNTPSTSSVTVYEHKAPTDKSLELLGEARVHMLDWVEENLPEGEILFTVGAE